MRILRLYRPWPEVCRGVEFTGYNVSPRLILRPFVIFEYHSPNLHLLATPKLRVVNGKSGLVENARYFAGI